MTRSTPRATTHLHACSPGKTIFLKFMLARLISAGQVALLYKTPKIYLFYRGGVYSQNKSEGFNYLPWRPRTGYCPIWALIDGDYEGEGISLGGDSAIWPIHATSPNPKRWKEWLKQNNGAILGMPLWNVEELVEGCVFSLFSLSAIDPGHVIR